MRETVECGRCQGDGVIDAPPSKVFTPWDSTDQICPRCAGMGQVPA